ncbi:MAG: transposase [Planctomycetes bacterium]|nr:transposase [Planctomycetota bacterium]
MPRNARLEFPGTLYHVSNRGNDRAKVFLDDHDYEHFVEILERVRDRQDLRVYHWALAPAGYRMLVETGERPSLAAAMQSLQLAFTRYFHRRYGRSGHLWAGRFKSFVVEKERHLLELGRYVEMEPVRRGLASDPATWRWTSFGAYVFGRPDRITRVDGMFRSLGSDDDARRRAYGALAPTYTEEALAEIDVLGSDEFRRQQIEKRREALRPRRGRPASRPHAARFAR